MLLAAMGAAGLALLMWPSSEGRAVSGGDAYSVPSVVDSNPASNIVETTLTSNEGTAEVGPNGRVATNAQMYNGSIPGPTFRLNVGDTVIVHYQNDLEHESGIHWHGIELPNGVDGTPFTQNMVSPGGNFLYKFVVNRPGIFWYHPHHHSSTNQVFKGLYGMIIVKDPNEDALQGNGTIPSDADTHPIVLSDISVCKTPGSNGFGASGNTYDDNTVAPAGSAPWAGSGAANMLPPQADPTIKQYCEGPAVGGDPYPIDEDGVLKATPYGNGEIPAIQTFDHNGRTNEGQTVLTNGKNVGGRAGGPSVEGYVPGALDPGAEVLDVRPGQGIRLQLVNSSAVRYMRLRLTRGGGSIVTMRRIGGEGGLLNNVVTEGGTQGGWVTDYSSGEILLPPGTRADVVAAIPAAAAGEIMTLWTRDYDRTGMGMTNIPTVPVMHLNVTGAAVPQFALADGTPLRAATGDPVDDIRSDPADPLVTPSGGFVAPKLGTINSNINFDRIGMTSLSVNGTFGTHDVAGDYKNALHLGSTRYAEQGDTLGLTTQNGTPGAHHPFHEHGFSIMPVQMDFPPFNSATVPGVEDFQWTYPEFRDNVDIPDTARLHFKMRLDPRPLVDGTTAGGALGRWLFHCHIFFHATNGMLSELVVTNALGNERPDINVDDYELTVRRGNAATVTGTFGNTKDAGDSVSLSTSDGTITDTGGGTFSWRLGRPRGADRQVYMTATDSNGLKGQIAAHLNKWPELNRFRVRPRTIKRGRAKTRKQGSVSAKKATRIRFRITEAATVRFKIRRLVGKKARGKAIKFRRKIKSAGNKKVKITTKFRGGGSLRPGRYLLTAVATDGTGLKSKTYKTKFKVVR